MSKLTKTHRLFGGLLASVALFASSVDPAGAQTAMFTNMQDVRPRFCFSAGLSRVEENAVNIGIETGFDGTTWTYKGCAASTGSFSNGTMNDTFTVTVTAPEGQRISAITYDQAGTHGSSRGYFSANGTGVLTVTNVALPFNFVTPTLSRTISLAGQNVTSTTVSVSINLRAYRNSLFPRVKAPPGGAGVEVTKAIIRAQFE